MIRTTVTYFILFYDFTLLSMKDFYSHSNWLELGRDAPYSTLIRPDQPLESLAGIVLLLPVHILVLRAPLD